MVRLPCVCVWGGIYIDKYLATLQVYVCQNLQTCGWGIVFLSINRSLTDAMLQVSLSLLYHFSHCKYSDKLQSLLSLVLTSTVKIYHSMYNEKNPTHSICILLIRRRFHFGSFFSSITALWNKLLRVHASPIITIWNLF